MSTPRFLSLPSGVRRTFAETSRGRFAALEALPGSGVPERWPALLVPGFTGSKEDFLAVLQTLAASGRRVLAVDLRGQYESPAGTGPEAYTRAALGADVAALAESLGADLPVHLVGHSFGGLVARETVLAGTVPVASLTLMSSGPGALTGPSADKALLLRDSIPQLGMAQIWDLVLGPDAVGRGVPPEIVEFLKARTLGNCETGLMAMATELTSCPDRVDELAKLVADEGLHTLVLYGEDDDVWDPRVQAAMAERLGARKVVIPSAAHSPAVDAPETAAAALTDFWAAAERTLR
ncbi:alpha/beta fold hydrolase [Actinomadura rupiterrae]|uniref:alpha/beta fold hydrolase n=1 Tax=Actinomadura rupiterrae TaxID=559627 RepID=UPI0020A2BC29|nr:alpha/beta fold hydrolase [Actinomadura rupiterrae]MCP2336495.1 pimeloyl-ACP methyl ester carboxylesterase [Actinomadura rupiterrae]